MFTKTGLRVRDTHSGSLTRRPGGGRRLPPIPSPTRTPLRHIVANKSTPHRKPSSNARLLRATRKGQTTSPSNEDRANVKGVRRQRESSVINRGSSLLKPKTRRSNRDGGGALTIGGYSRDGQEERGRNPRHRSTGSTYAETVNAMTVDVAGIIGRASIRRRTKPEWDDTLRDHSQYRLTPEEAVQRKKSLLSKHNTLVFGLGHDCSRPVSFASKRPLAVTTFREKEVTPVTAAAAATEVATAVATSVAVAAAQVGATRAEGSSMRKEIFSQVTCKRVGQISGCNKAIGGGMNTNGVGVGGESSEATGLIRKAKKQSVSGGYLGGLSDDGGEDDETFCVEERPGIFNRIGGGDGVDINEITATSPYRYRHLTTSAACNADDRIAAEDDDDLLSLGGIEAGIQAFSQRVRQLDLGRKVGVEDCEDAGQEKTDGRREDDSQAPTTDKDAPGKCPPTHDAVFPGGFDAGDFGQDISSENTDTDDYHEREESSSPTARLSHGTSSITDGCRRDENDFRRSSSAVGREKNTKDDKEVHTRDAVAVVENLSPSSKTNVTRNNDDLDEENGQLVEQIRLIEAQVRGLRLDSGEENVVISNRTGLQEERPRDMQVYTCAAPQTVELRAVVADLLSLSAGLLTRATAAERRLRKFENRDNYLASDSDSDPGSGTLALDDDEEGHLLTARARSTIRTPSPVSFAVKNCTRESSNPRNNNEKMTALTAECDEEREAEDDAQTRVGSFALQFGGTRDITTSSVTPAQTTAVTMAPKGSPSRQYGQEQQEQQSGRATSTPGARRRSGVSPCQFVPGKHSAAFNDDGHRHQQWRSGGFSPLQRLRLASVAPAQDCWGEALDAVSGLVASPPVSAHTTPTAAIASGGGNFRSITAFGEGEAPGLPASSSTFGTGSAVGIGGFNCFKEHIKPRPRIVLAPIDRAVLAASRERVRGAIETTASPGVSNTNKRSNSCSAAAGAVDWAPALRTPVSPSPAAADVSSVEAVGVRHNHNARGSIEPDLATRPPTPMRKPTHPFGQRGDGMGRQLPRVRSPPRWLYQQAQHEGAMKEEEMAGASVLSSPPANRSGVSGDGGEDAGWNRRGEGVDLPDVGHEKKSLKTDDGCGNGGGDRKGGISIFSPPVGAWYTPLCS